MPRETYNNLEEGKRERVYRAIISEFTRVPLEEVSIKNIVIEAGIPRGSFYQYFDDKEDVLRYLILQTRREGESDVRSEASEVKDIFDFISFLCRREADALAEDSMTLPMKILNQITRSPRAMAIFNEEIGKGTRGNTIFKSLWDASGLESLSDDEREALMDLLISSLKEAFVTILMDRSKADKAQGQLAFKLGVIKAGLGQNLT